MKWLYQGMDSIGRVHVKLGESPKRRVFEAIKAWIQSVIAVSSIERFEPWTGLIGSYSEYENLPERMHFSCLPQSFSLPRLGDLCNCLLLFPQDFHSRTLNEKLGKQRIVLYQALKEINEPCRIERKKEDEKRLWRFRSCKRTKGKAWAEKIDSIGILSAVGSSIWINLRKKSKIR